MDLKRINQLVFSSSHAGVSAAQDLGTTETTPRSRAGYCRTMRHIHTPLNTWPEVSRPLQIHIGSCGLAAAGLAYDPDNCPASGWIFTLLTALILFGWNSFPRV